MIQNWLEDQKKINQVKIISLLLKKLGRNHLCGCGKEYLSYPALYTHIKQKHGGE